MADPPRRRKKPAHRWTYSEETALSVDDVLGSSDGVRALTEYDIDVVFQPIVDLRTKKLFAVEHLVRSKADDYPHTGALLSAADEEQAMGRFGRLIRDVGFRRCPPGMASFVNVHPHELASRWLVRPDDPMHLHDGAIFIEVTESTALDYFALCRDVLQEICARTGANLVVDDLGAGHSNLLRIIDLEPKVVKLDLALVQGVAENRRKRILMRNVVRLCEELGASVVAEGIESVDDLKAVIDQGCHFGQGYLLAKPGHPVPEVVWPEDGPAPSRSEHPPPPMRRFGKPES
ncbi:MAG: EAL domain-containing protein [Myxococcota bacterium]